MIRKQHCTPHGVSAFYRSPRNTFGFPVLLGLEPTMSSTDYGSTVYDIIFVGGIVLSNSILSELQLCWPLELGQEGLLLVLLQVVLPRPILSWKFWWVFKKKSLVHQYFSDSKSLKSWKLVHTTVMNQMSYSQGAIFASAFLPQKYLRLIWQNIVLLCVVVQRSLLQDGPFAEDHSVTSTIYSPILSHPAAPVQRWPRWVDK